MHSILGLLAVVGYPQLIDMKFCLVEKQFIYPLFSHNFI